MRRSQVLLAAALCTLAGWQARAADRVWTGAVNNDFFNAGNWNGGAPENGDDQVVVQGGANLPVVIPAGTGVLELGAIELGYNTADPGRVVQNGGTFNIFSYDPRSAGSGFATDFRSHIGRVAGGTSSWIMHNDAMLLFDDPSGANTAGLGSDGFGNDLEVGAQSGNAGGEGRLEVHDSGIVRISDDLKIGAEGNGNGVVIADGNAQISVGSGISVSENGGSKGVLTIAGNATVVSGNSAGAGDMENGRTDEGYLTLSTAADGRADVTLSDNAKLYVRTLQQRNGVTNVTIGGSAQFHIFDTFKYAAPNLGNATIEGLTSDQGSPRMSQIASGTGADIKILIKDNGVMTVDSALDNPTATGFTGLSMSGASNTGGPEQGGKSVLAVQDQGTFRVAQDLHVGHGTGATTNAELLVQGPAATVNVQGDLRLAMLTDFSASGGRGALHAVITNNTHSTVVVGGAAYLGFGELLVEFSGYSPRGGESYTLVSAGSIPDDFATSILPTLPDGLSWNTTKSATAYTLSIAGSIGLLTDLNKDGGVDAADAGLMFGDWGNTPGSPADFNSDGVVDAADAGAMFADWTGDSISSVPEPTSGGLALLALLGYRAAGRRRPIA